jgi:hypothetical protein
MKSNGINYDIVLSSPTWVELTGAAYLNQGYYNIIASAAYSSDPGIFQYCAKAVGANNYYGVVKIAAGDTTVIYGLIGLPFSGTLAASLTSTYIQVVSGVAGAFTAADRTVIANASSSAMSASATSSLIYARVGVPAGASVSADIAAIKAVIGTPFSGTVSADLTATYHQAALAAAGGGGGGFTAADRTMLTDTSSTLMIVSSTIGLTFSGTVAAALTATYHQAAVAAVGGGATDLTPVLVGLTATLARLGKPVTTVSKDIYEVARLVKELKKP